MAENLERYNKALQSLHSIYVGDTDIQKILFHNSGLFGGLKESHSVLELFANYIIKTKRENKHITPELINSHTFLDYLKLQKANGNHNVDDVIVKIESMKGKIQDEPVAQKNTLYQFAVILEDLGVLEPGKENLVTSRYNDALENAAKFAKPIAKVAGKSPVASTNIPTVAPAPSTGQQTKASPSALSPFATAGTAARSNKSNESAESKNELTASIQVDQANIQPATAQTINKTEEKAETKQEPEAPKEELSTESPAKMTVAVPSFAKTNKKEEIISGEGKGEGKGEGGKLKIPTETAGEREVYEPRETGTEGNIRTPSYGRPQIIRPQGGGLRKRVSPTMKIRDVSGLKGPQNRGPEDQMAAKQPGEIQSQQTGQPSSSEEEQQSTSSGKEKNLAKTLAKVAGGSVLAGTAWPFLGGANDSAANAAGFITHIIHFKPLLSIIHLFIK